MVKKQSAVAGEQQIREFINHICEGDLAKANECLNNAVKEKLKDRIHKQQVKENN